MHLDAMIATIRQGLDAARARNLPVVFTTIAYDESPWQLARLFLEEVPALQALRTGTPAWESGQTGQVTLAIRPG